MPKRPADKDFQDTKNRIEVAQQNPAFDRNLKSFFKRWQSRHFPDLYWEERDASWDEEQHGVVYRGLYYELRDFCDRYGLWWMKDGGYVLRLLYALKEGLDQSEVLIPDDCPPPQHWQWFRMARTGLKLPREEEINKVRRAHAPRFTDGITVEDIAEHFAGEKGVTPETVRRAIANCRRYLDRGADFRQIRQIASLTEDESFRLFWSYHAEAVKQNPKP